METIQTNVNEAIASFGAIKEKIAETGVEVPEGTKARELANKIPEVYEAGYDALWDEIQDSGNRTNYSSAFSKWGGEYIRPKYKVIPTHEHGVTQVFNTCKKLKKVEAKYFDFSQKPQNLTSANTNFGYYYTFSTCVALEEIEDIGLIAQNHYYYAFAYCYKLRTIAKIGVDENTVFNTTFQSCQELENITIDGTLAQNGFDIHWSTKLTAKSLYSIISALSKTTTGLTITLPTTAEANYNANPPTGAPATWAELVATKNNWSIVYA